MKSKWCWVAREFKAGWKVHLAIANYDTKALNYYFQSVADVEKVLPKGKVVFVHMAKCAVGRHGEHTK